MNTQPPKPVERAKTVLRDKFIATQVTSKKQQARKISNKQFNFIPHCGTWSQATQLKSQGIYQV